MSAATLIEAIKDDLGYLKLHFGQMEHLPTRTCLIAGAQRRSPIRLACLMQPVRQ
jgi:hypothetical protein